MGLAGGGVPRTGLRRLWIGALVTLALAFCLVPLSVGSTILRPRGSLADDGRSMLQPQGEGPPTRHRRQQQENGSNCGVVDWNGDLLINVDDLLLLLASYGSMVDGVLIDVSALLELLS